MFLLTATTTTTCKGFEIEAAEEPTGRSYEMTQGSTRIQRLQLLHTGMQLHLVCTFMSQDMFSHCTIRPFTTNWLAWLATTILRAQPA